MTDLGCDCLLWTIVIVCRHTDVKAPLMFSPSPRAPFFLKMQEEPFTLPSRLPHRFVTLPKAIPLVWSALTYTLQIHKQTERTADRAEAFHVKWEWPLLSLYGLGVLHHDGCCWVLHLSEVVRETGSVDTHSWQVILMSSISPIKPVINNWNGIQPNNTNR